ncbi:peptidoglycan DD-metalloendopeptidase family protein [Niveibacterium sp. 24ML]|uniref:peptidoglycan DD-metalloendopeptidase family protein n=1 Tax=Niveibacterium sp. 24ML TaxID=2985512 RepID=UPI00226FD414|nr:peptidoglycan DD-metalloendopeptidase family protein [Niveibacterium sp. 24ML]MCX9156793.1 peptidoglycan DD-metalloendopeptidase family protein [Niveibacterium sp. 24ML]
MRQGAASAAAAALRHIVMLLALLCATSVAAATGGAADIDARKADLDELHQRIRSLQEEIAASEASRTEAADELSDAEKAISTARRRLREIASERVAAEAELRRREAERDAVAARLEGQRKALGDTLYRYYVFGRRAGTRTLLGSDDPNQIARDAYYLERLAEARRAEIEAARASLAEHERLIEAVRQRREAIAALEREQAAQTRQLQDEQKKRAEVLARIQDKIKAQRKQVSSLKQDEKRLGKLIDGLSRLPPPRPVTKPKPKPAQDAASRSQSAKPSAGAQAKPEVQRQPGAPEVAAEPVTGKAEDTADERTPSIAFAGLKGKLKWPVRGELVGRFGAPRAEGGAQWKGVFIRAAEGDVRAVAAGRVVYADWLRGFGNLVIVDHGDGFMTVYGNNEALYKPAGSIVKAGDPLASIGASGGSEESGLYFEIRHHGQAQDPAKWVSAR